MNGLVQNASPPSPSPPSPSPPSPSPPSRGIPGRPPSYEHDQVIGGAVTLFWESGYNSTSLADLEVGLGVNRSTLYASFGGKAGLYDAAVDAYVASMGATLVAPLKDGTSGVADLLAFVDRLGSILLDPTNPAGCLIVNAMGSGDPPAATEQYLADLRVAFDATLRRAAARGEVDPSTVADKVSSVLTSAIGLNVAAKSGLRADEVGHLVDGVRAVIRGWATDD